jgi:signal peptidase II
MRLIRNRAVIFGLLALLVGCDHVTKYAAKSQLEGLRPYDLIRGALDLRYTENTDVAFNLLRWMPEATRRPMLVLTGGAVVLFLLLVLMRRAGLPSSGLALLLITAGAVGNYADRVLRGYVVDFVHVPHWPVFNVADAYVTLGAILLGVVTLKDRGRGLRTPV